MRINPKPSITLLAALAVVLAAIPAMASGPASAPKARQGSIAVAYPWAFENGTTTSRRTAITSAEEIGRKAGYASVPAAEARSAWKSNNYPARSFGHLPSKATLESYGLATHASEVMYGSVSWHTRSVWVNLGPKTISTATVDVYVFDVRANKVVFKSLGITGRSDEKSNVYKVAADILITPLVTAVSGGPATPQEQRAVQIALGVAYHPWVRSSR